jgi:hypothetical protein
MISLLIEQNEGVRTRKFEILDRKICSRNIPLTNAYSKTTTTIIELALTVEHNSYDKSNPNGILSLNHS